MLLTCDKKSQNRSEFISTHYFKGDTFTEIIFFRCFPMNPQISVEIGFKFRINEIPISLHKGVLSCFFNHSFYTTIYEIQSITVKQQPHNVPVLNILMQSVSTPNNPKTYDSGPCFRGRALHP